ncbi:hypothetical protein NHG29_04280 [Aerococcaceae bacterium NML160702]|nr:hypothetical protein [Aerococcaceae bacterium NML160702]
MTWYNMTKEVEGILEMSGEKLEDLRDRYDLRIFGEGEVKDFEAGIYVCHRNKYRSVLARYEELKEAERAKAERELREKHRQERLAGFHWVKDNYEWVVSGDFTGVKEGDEITIIKANGDRQQRVVVSFTSKGYAKVK